MSFLDVQFKVSSTFSEYQGNCELKVRIIILSKNMIIYIAV